MDTKGPNISIVEVIPRAPSPLGTLDKLPLEIRSMIYENLFVFGNVALTRTSKALHEDTKQSLRKHGACRVRIQHVIGRIDGHYVTRYAQDFRLDSIPSYVPTMALTFHFEQVCYPAARVYHEVDGLEELFSKIVDRLTKPQRCHLTFDFEEMDTSGGEYMNPMKVPRRYDALRVLQRFQAVTVEVSYGRWYWRDRSAAWLQWLQKRDANGYDAMIAKIKDKLAPDDPSDPGPKITVFRTIRYTAEDGWVKFLEYKEEEERIAFRLPERSERLSHDVRYCP